MCHKHGMRGGSMISGDRHTVDTDTLSLVDYYYHIWIVGIEHR